MSVTLEGPLADRSAWQADACSIGKAMEVIGTRSAVLLLREAFYGTTRFDDFASRVGITDAVTAARLKQLVNLGVFARHPYREPGQRTRYEYHLTQMGRDLFPAVFALMQWGDEHLQHSGGPLTIVERETGAPITIAPRSESGEILAVEDVAIRSNEAWAAADRDSQGLA